MPTKRNASGTSHRFRYEHFDVRLTKSCLFYRQLNQPLHTDVAGSDGIFDSQCDSFDRISFTWNGRHGAKVLFKFNCLSTDFSRIKGVKGIPLRIAAETHVIDNEHQIEKAFCKIKLFRDKASYPRKKTTNWSLI